MSQDRHVPGLGSAEADIAVRSLGLRLPPNFRIDPHQHDWHQLVYATEGVMRVETPTASWVVPPDRAVWIPAGFEHSIQMTGTVRMRTVYLRPGMADGLPLSCGVIHMTPLLRELVLETLQRGMLHDRVPEQARLAAVIADQILRTREAPLQIHFPADARACAVAIKAQADLARRVPIRVLVRGCGASVRTIERLFVQETGLTFGRWLQRVRALHAIGRLAAGDSVTDAGLAVGYDSTSAFIAMFKRVVGRTPGSLDRDRENQPES
jgi:AraC-like DNA-binding protein